MFENGISKIKRSKEVIREEGLSRLTEKLINLIMWKINNGLNKANQDNFIKDHYNLSDDIDVSSGSRKDVYRVKINKDDEKEYAVSILNKYFTQPKEKWLGSLRESRDIYKKFFPDYVNPEKLISSQDERSVICIQPWVEEVEKYKDIFNNIVENSEKIISLSKIDEKFKGNILNFFKDIINVYEEVGVFPDLFNFVINVPSNVFYSKDGIKIIDMHTIYYSDSNINWEKLGIEEQEKGQTLVRKNDIFFTNLVEKIKSIIFELER